MKKTFSTRDVYHSGKPLPERRSSRGSSMALAPLRFVARMLGLLLHWFASSSSPKDFLRRCVLFCSAIIGIGILCGILWVTWLLITLPDVDDIGALFAAESTVITDRNGIELYRIHADEDRTLVPLSDIAGSVKLATIAIEDERFYERGCMDTRALLRVVLRMGKGGGGSTITRQLARNALDLKRESLVSRKFKELVLGCQLEDRYSKDKVIELYLNRIPYGHNAHGVEQAARIYFAKSASGLTLAESSILAALPQRPTYFSPYGRHVFTQLSETGEQRLKDGEILTSKDIQDADFWIGLIGEEFALTSSGTVLYQSEHGSGAFVGDTIIRKFRVGGRTDQVLANMEDMGFITDTEKQQALQELQTMTFQRARENIRAPHFVLWVREQISEEFSDSFDEGYLEQGGLHVVTTLDWGLQQSAEAIVREIGEHNMNLYDAHNAALVSVDPDNGHILAYVGNRDYWDEATDGNVDIARSPRQPGSSFKPFAYSAAFVNGYSPATVLYDVPTKIGDDEPENYDGAFLGPLTIRRALGGSRNIPAAKAFFLAGGEERIVGLVEQMGLSTPVKRRKELSAATGEPYEYGWPLALGAAETPLLEMAAGYSVFARGGTYIPLVSILRIEDRRGNILFESPSQPEQREVLDPRIAYMITSILSDPSVRPTQYWRDQLSIPHFATAAKTGTSNKCLRRDRFGACEDRKPDNTWTIGYTPELVTGVWAGNASGGALYPKASGLDTASHIWKRFMTSAHRALETEKNTFEVPLGLASTQISELSGDLASTCTPTKFRRAEFFREESTPTRFDSACVVAEVDKLTGLLASEECPAEAREEQSFFSPHSILPDRWPLWEEGVRAWANAASSGTGTLTVGTGGLITGSGLLAVLPLPLLPEETCRLSLTPGRLVKPTLSIVSPAKNGSASAPSFRPRIAYTVGHEVSEVRYEIDGLLMARGTNTDITPEIRLPRRFDTSGTHTLVVTLVDSYFNAVQKSVRFTFIEDKSGPSIQILEPGEGAMLTRGTTIRVRAEAQDREGGIDRVQFFLGPQLIRTVRREPYQVDMEITAPLGITKIRAVARDGARNESEAEIVVKVVE
jgi:membrane peptidoglycan carboxypeptidase